MRLSPSTWQQPVPPARSAARTALLDALAAEVAARPGRVVVAVDGATGAGKTSVAHELGLALERRGRPVLRACLDDHKRPWSERHLYDRESGEGYYRNATDLDRIRSGLVGAFRAGPAVALCGIDPLTQVDHGGDRTDVGPQDVLVVDGVFVLRPELRELWDVVVRLVVDPAVALERAVGRDTDRSGREEALAVHRLRYGVADEVYRAEADPDAAADVLVDNTDLDAPVRLR